MKKFQLWKTNAADQQPQQQAHKMTLAVSSLQTGPAAATKVNRKRSMLKKQAVAKSFIYSSTI
jgi:hypothetical protein